jgi:hypothetical protein
MKKITVATVAAGLTALSLGLAAPAIADDWDITPVATGNDTSLNTAYRDGGPQGTPTPRVAGTTTITGAPADVLPMASPGANPFVPLGPGH